MDEPNGGGSGPTGATADDGVSTHLRHRRGVDTTARRSPSHDAVPVATAVEQDPVNEQQPSNPLPRWAYVIFVARGTVALALGVSLLFAGANLSRLTTFVAIYWIVAALLTLHWVLVHRVVPHRRLAFVAGTLALVAGLAVVLRSVIHALVGEGLLLDLLGASAIAIGILRLLGTIHDDQLAQDHPRRRYRFVVGTLEVLLGVALLLADKAATDQIRVALSVWGLSTGTFLLLDALMLRRATRTDGWVT
jgi:uncharacterized membrane protein HdeD (DUF308 family)